MPTIRFPVSHLALAAALVLAACTGTAEKEKAAPTASAAPTLDESQLPPVLRFAASDLDKSKDPCVDLCGYVNAQWLAAHPIPSDRSSWGPGAMFSPSVSLPLTLRPGSAS